MRFLPSTDPRLTTERFNVLYTLFFSFRPVSDRDAATGRVIGVDKTFHPGSASRYFVEDRVINVVAFVHSVARTLNSVDMPINSVESFAITVNKTLHQVYAIGFFVEGGENLVDNHVIFVEGIVHKDSLTRFFVEGFENLDQLIARLWLVG